MARIRERRPSPAMIVAIVSLVFAVGGTAVAGVATISVLSKKEKKQTRGIARNEINKAAPSLSVAAAQNAGTLDGLDSTAFVRGGLREANGLALAGANVDANGTLLSWFNRFGGQPSVSHTASSGAYVLTFPGLEGQLQSNKVIELASLKTTGFVAATSNNGNAQVETFSTAGTGADRAFLVVVFDGVQVP